MLDRDERRAEKAKMEEAFAAERRSLQAQIDRCKSRGWFGFGGGSSGVKRVTKDAGVGGVGGGEKDAGTGAAPPKVGKIII